MPNIQNLTDRIRNLGTTAVIFKIDIKRAFRNFKMEPSDVYMLGLHWQNKNYLKAWKLKKNLKNVHLNHSL